MRAWAFLNTKRAEWLVWLIGLGAFLWLFRRPLLLGTTTMSHDHLWWCYPAYHFWAESLLQGRLPLWNPFSHGGEPFYSQLVQARLLDPNALFVLAIGSRLTKDLIVLYNWTCVTQGMLIATGSYLLLRRWALHEVTRLSLIPILLFSSFQLVGYRQPVIFYQFLWVPWALLILCKMVEERDSRWRWWLLLGLFLGVNAQSYHFVGIWTVTFVFVVGIGLFRRDLLRGLMRQPHFGLKAGVTLLLVGLMALPNAVLLVERNRFVFPVRTIDASQVKDGPTGAPIGVEPGLEAVEANSIIMPYWVVVQSGTTSTLWDFIQLIVPYANRWLNPVWHRGVWGHSSEAFMYFGLLVYAGAVYGLVAGRHPLKRVWLVLGLVVALLMLGPSGLLHPIVFYLFPPLWFSRHTHMLVLSFGLVFLYFYVIGLDRALSNQGPLGCQRPAPEEVPERSLASRSGWNIAGVTAGAVLIVAGLVVNRHALIGLRHAVPGILDWAESASSLIYLTQALLIGIGSSLVLVAMYRLLRDGPPARRRPVVAVSFMVLVIVLSAVFAVRVKHPYEWLAGTLTVAPLALAWRFRHSLPLEYRLGGIVGAHLLLVAAVGRALEQYVLQLALLAGPAVGLLWLHRRYTWLSSRWLLIGLALCLMLDLGCYAQRASFLWSVPRPDQVLGYNAYPQEPALASTRNPFPPCQAKSKTSACASEGRTPVYEQQLVYSELLFRVPVVFAPLVRNEPATQEWPGDIRQQVQEGLTGILRTSYLMPKGYFALRTAGLDPETVMSVFAVGQPLIQFKPEAQFLDERGALERLRQPAVDEGARSLDGTVIIIQPGEDDSGVPGASGGTGTDVGSPTMDWSVLRYDYNSLALRVRADRAGYLYWADGYDPFWRAYRSGEEIQVYRANVNFKAVRIDPGDQMLTFRYDPVWFKRALAAFYAACLLALGGWAAAMAHDRLERK